MGKANRLITDGTPGGSESSVEVFIGVYMWIIGTASQTDIQSLDTSTLKLGSSEFIVSLPTVPLASACSLKL